MLKFLVNIFDCATGPRLWARGREVRAVACEGVVAVFDLVTPPPLDADARRRHVEGRVAVHWAGVSKVGEETWG